MQRFPVRRERTREWGDTRIWAESGSTGVDVFMRRSFAGDELDPAELFATLPIAVLAIQP